MKNIFGIFLLSGLLTFGLTTPVSAQEVKPSEKSATGDNTEADAIWAELQKAFRPPAPPAEWREKKPSPEEIQKFKESQRELSGAAADKAKDFYTRFPKHPKAAEAREKELKLLGFAVQLGDTSRLARIEELEKQQLQDPNLGEDERFELRVKAVQRASQNQRSKGQEAVLAEFEKGARALQKDFPKREEIYQMLMSVAENSSGEKAAALNREIVNSSAPEEIKAAARVALKKIEAVGKPLAMQFTAVDGRKINLEKMPGKVVLVDFWATWCGPCIAELPHVKAAYDRLHPKGFEIIGISFDHDKEKLESFVAEEKMKWPQYFDGEGWKNKFGQEFGIHSIPSMWLVDKKGVLRDLNGQEDLEKKVEKYLAE